MATKLLNVLPILAAFTGIHSIITVNKVSVRAGGSISIPCFYDPRYKNHVKYLCKGAGWYGCTYEVKTNQPSTSGRFSISDDKKQRIFAVTINDLTAADTDYWCIVEINNGADDGQKFQLSVSTGLPSLYVDKQEVTGFKGGSVTVSCRSTFSGRMKWCRLGSICVTESGSIDRTAVTISASIGNVVNVTMSDLRFESSGWYWCAKGNLQMPVHITVYEQTTTTTTTTISPTTTNISPGTVEGQQSPSKYLKSFIISLSLLIFIVMVALFIWWMLKRRQQAEKIDSSPATVAEQEITYSDVKHIKKPSRQRSYAESNVDVLYSTVAPKQSSQRAAPKDQSIIYSNTAECQM
ncbi:polymeric immunoglobulin receptor-like [Myripristis murdjan]|uniref:polymeric immunoglobulin receptor-like n=1 Tax=Myripristis murdjan TaxID=586833 RepID=UPI0011763592|nr:polymeric immunoglobulin receptor-like [Myripristis murdjan]